MYRQFLYTCNTANIFQIIHISSRAKLASPTFTCSRFRYRAIFGRSPIRSNGASLYNSSGIYLFLASFIFARQTGGRRTVRRPRKINSIDFVWQQLDTLVYRADGCQLYSIVRARSDWLQGVAGGDVRYIYIMYRVFSFYRKDGDRFFDKYGKQFFKRNYNWRQNYADIL